MKKPSLLVILVSFVAVFASTQITIANNNTASLSDKAILAALMQNLDVSLKDAKHCDNVGIDENDRSIGDYLSGFWAFHASKAGKNWLEINTSKSAKGRYLARVMIYRKDGEENWGWGISFELDKNKKVKRNSFTCLGSG